MLGFSRGAFQVRVLSAMIEKVRLALCLQTVHWLRSRKIQVGLIHKGNEMQIPLCVLNLYLSRALIDNFSAYELYADRNSGPNPAKGVGSQNTNSQENPCKADHFKKTFSHENVKVHFVGAWCIC